VPVVLGCEGGEGGRQQHPFEAEVQDPGSFREGLADCGERRRHGELETAREEADADDLRPVHRVRPNLSAIRTKSTKTPSIARTME
jgi:hypothetical protein